MYKRHVKSVIGSLHWYRWRIVESSASSNDRYINIHAKFTLKFSGQTSQSCFAPVNPALLNNHITCSFCGGTGIWVQDSIWNNLRVIYDLIEAAWWHADSNIYVGTRSRRSSRTTTLNKNIVS